MSNIKERKTNVGFEQVKPVWELREIEEDYILE